MEVIASETGNLVRGVFGRYDHPESQRAEPDDPYRCGRCAGRCRAPLVAPFKAFLQTAGIAAPPEELHRLANVLGTAGVTRICALGNMTAPEAGWHHDGRFNLLDLISMVEIEQSAEAAAETFAPLYRLNTGPWILSACKRSPTHIGMRTANRN